VASPRWTVQVPESAGALLIINRLYRRGSGGNSTGPRTMRRVRKIKPAMRTQMKRMMGRKMIGDRTVVPWLIAAAL